MTDVSSGGTELKLPLLGDVMTEGTLAAWLQPDGATVQQGDPLYKLETDKVSFTVDAPSAGRLERVIAEGDTVPVGTLVGRLVEPASAEPAADVRASPAARRLAAELGVDLAAVSGGRRIREADVQAFHDARPGSANGEHDVRATPAARALARQLSVDLATVGGGRRLREADVQAFHDARGKGVESAVAVPNVSESAEGSSSMGSEPSGALEGRRKVIAERMRASLSQMAQLTIALEVDMTEAMRFREQLKHLLPSESQPTVTDLVIRAAVLALAEHVAVNATLQDGALTVHEAVHMGLAVDAPEGLIVPVIRDAHTLPLRALTERTRDLAHRARDNELALEDVQGGTFTVTSLGTLGVDFFTPIVNPPQVAILGIGRIFPKLALEDGRPVERQAMYLNLSFDHQAVDGAPAARFLQSVKRLLELPAGLVI